MNPLNLTDSQAQRLLAGEHVEVRKRMPRMEPWIREQIASGHRRIRNLFDNVWGAGCGTDGAFACRMEDTVCCPFGEPGSVLWVRETCRAEELADDTDVVRYRADGECVVIENTEQAVEQWCDLWNTASTPGSWQLARSMPRWACRMYARCIELRVDTSGERPEWVGVFERAAETAEREE